MQKRIACALLLMCAAATAQAQGPAGVVAVRDAPHLELSVGYTFLHSNAGPGNCGCFSMNGATGSAAFGLTRNLNAVADVTAGYNGNVDSSNHRLVLASYLIGPRYSYHGAGLITPFIEAFAGVAHADGLGYSGATGPSSAFAAAAGGGIDLRTSRHFAVRLLEADYYFTHFQNGVNSRENNLRLTFGFNFLFGKN